MSVPPTGTPVDDRTSIQTGEGGIVKTIHPKSWKIEIHVKNRITATDNSNKTGLQRLDCALIHTLLLDSDTLLIVILASFSNNNRTSNTNWNILFCRMQTTHPGQRDGIRKTHHCFESITRVLKYIRLLNDAECPWYNRQRSPNSTCFVYQVWFIIVLLSVYFV